MSLKRAQTLTVHRVPHVGRVILGTGEQQVSFAVVLDLCDGSVMAVESDWFLCVYVNESVCEADNELQSKLARLDIITILA